MPGNRPRALKRTLIIPEWEPYGPARNMLHVWQDRPLFSDPALREGKQGFAGWFRDLEVLHDCNFDGLGSLDYEGIHMDQLRLLATYPHPEHTQMICMSGSISFPRAKSLITRAAKSKYTTRVDGKVLVWTYNGSPDHLVKLAEQLKADPEVPPHILISGMPMMDVYGAFSPTNDIPEAVLAKQRAKIAAAAKAFGGFQLWHTEFEQDHEGSYGMHAEPTDIWRKYLLPLTEAELAKPENRGKLVGSYLRNGYINRFVGWVQCERGTHTLRTSFDELMPINPDLLVPFEWNEENENTHFQPTVAHGKTWARICNYYRALLDREQPKPLKGDDTSIPNLIVSFRQMMLLGEEWHAELLYLPDGDKNPAFTAQLTLKGAKGQVLKTFPLETFKTGELLAINYRVPSEQFADEAFVSVELETNYAGVKKVWTGFDSTRIHPTKCFDCLYTHHPLRELLEPVKAEFAVQPAEDGASKLSVKFEAKEDLASVEILDGVEEIAADDPDKVFDQTKYAVFRLKFDSPMGDLFGGGIKAYRTGTLRFPSAPNAVVRNPCMNWGAVNVRGKTNDAWVVTFQFGAFSCLCDVLVPRAELKDAKMVMDYPIAGHAEIDLAECERLGRKDFTLGGHVHMQVVRMEELPDLPRLLDSKMSDFAVTRMSHNRFPAYQVRAIAKSGKIWRSPVECPRKPSAAKRTITVQSDTQRKPVAVTVAADTVPVSEYRFDPQNGALLKSFWDDTFDITLGGGGNYANPMCSGPRKAPKDFLRTDPVWLKEDGQMTLRFDNGSYLALPQEVLPHGSEFTLEFEIKPDDADKYVLLRSNTVGGDCGLELSVKGGVLHGSYAGVKMYVMPDFNTGLAIPKGRWSCVKIEKALDAITFTVNGKSKRFDWTRRARLFSGAIFGSDVSVSETIPEKMSGFNGFLRSFKIAHGRLP